MKNVIFLAPPAAGKGTFSDYLVESYGYQHYSTGDNLRAKAKEDKSLADFLKTGALVDDETMLKIIREVLTNVSSKESFILDGFPRTLHQAENLDIILHDLGLSYVVIYIDVEKNILEKRVVGRRVCPNCHQVYNVEMEGFGSKDNVTCDKCSTPLIHRDEDQIDTFQKRYQIYLESTKDLIRYYKEKGLLYPISNNDLDQENALKLLRGVVSEH